MKIIILENKLQDSVKSMIKDVGIKSAIDFVGGWESFCIIMNFNSPMDFLHLFDDLEVVQSEENEYLTLFRNKKGKNLMIYDREDEFVFINYNEIWSFLVSIFGLNNFEIMKLTKKWVGDVYNLRGIKTRNGYSILS